MSENVVWECLSCWQPEVSSEGFAYSLQGLLCVRADWSWEDGDLRLTSDEPKVDQDGGLGRILADEDSEHQRRADVKLCEASCFKINMEECKEGAAGVAVWLWSWRTMRTLTYHRLELWLYNGAT